MYHQLKCYCKLRLRRFTPSLSASFVLVLLIGGILQSHAQTPGLIIKPGSPGITPLDPNGDGFVSVSATGFQSNDLGESEIVFKDIPYVMLEPTGDLRRGPAGMYSDIVKDPATGSGVGVYNDGTNLIFRMRLGGTVSGSKCYAILIDTDGKFGATGPNADPNFQAQTTGINGNPGFEIEIDLQTNFRVAVYNVDGISNPSTPTVSYAHPANTQIAIALSATSGTPDFFYDWYVPLSALTPLGVTSSTPLRFAATTGMAPLPVIGGPKSDIFGIDDEKYSSTNDAWTDLIVNTPSVTLTDLTSGGPGFPPACTQAPGINAPVSTGANIAVTGTWERLTTANPATATITLYKNGLVYATTTVNTGGTWSINVATVSAGNTFYARAQSNGESQCEQSSVVTATSCNTSNTTTTSGLSVTCLTIKGIQGERPAGASIRIYRITSSGFTLYATDGSTASPSGHNLYYGTGATASTWYYDGANATGGNPCSGAANSMSAGSYAATATTTGSCESGFIISSLCIGSPSPTVTATPVISNTPLVEGLSTISGTAATGATVFLFVNNRLVANATATGGNYSFTGLSNIKATDVVNVRAISSGNFCISTAASATVQCLVAPPLIDANSSNQIPAGALITGTSIAGTGATINIFNSANTLLGSATVLSNGTFASSITAVAGTNYYARAVTTCGTSNSSATVSALTAVSSSRCGSITASTATTTSSSVSGTLGSALSGTTVTLYLDSVAIGSVVTATTSWSIAVNTTYTNKLYPGGKLMIGITESGKQEVICATAVIIACPVNAMPTVSPSNVMMSVTEQVKYALSTSVSGVLYTLEDASSFSDWAVSKFGSGSAMTIGTYSFDNTGTFTLRMKGTSFDGMGCDATANVTVTVINKAPIANNLFAPPVNSSAASTPLPALTAGDPDGAVVSYKIITLPSVNAGVLYLCNPSCAPVTAQQVIAVGDVAKLQFDPESAFTGTATFTYSATDDRNLEGNVAAYNISVYTHPPAANHVLAQKITYISAPVQLPPLSASDPDGSVVSYTIVDVPNSQQGTLYFCNPNCAYVLPGKVIQPVNVDKFMFAPAANFTGLATFRYTATDNSGAVSEEATFTIPVGQPDENLPPVSQRVESPTINNNAGLTAISPLYGIDTDGTIESYSVLTLPVAAEGTLYLCVPSCTPVSAGQTLNAGFEDFLQFAPNPSFMGTASFTYAAKDDEGALGNTARYEIPVTNNAPVANPVTAQIISNAVAQNAIPSLTGYDRDGSIVSFTIASLPVAGSGTLYLCNPSCAVVSQGQTVIPADANKLRFEPAASFSGDAVFSYTVTDNNGNISAHTQYTIPVRTMAYGNGLPPVTNNVNDEPISHNATATNIAALSGTDADGTISEFLILSVPTPEQGALLLCNPSCAPVTTGQALAFADASALAFAPASSFSGNAVFKFAARDDKGNLGNAATFTIPVTASRPVAYHITSSVLSANDPAVSIPSLVATSPTGTIAGYKITSLPHASQGILYLCTPSCAAVTENQVIAASNADKLRFDPAPQAVGLLAMFNYRAVDNTGRQGNTATYNIPFTGGATVLPVQLTSFNASLLLNGTVEATWHTLAEYNSAYFEVERSADAGTWHLVGSRAAAGFSSQPLAYQLLDPHPMNGINYYRLKSVDLDGLVRFSHIQSVYVVQVMQNNVTVYPVPASTHLQVQFDLQSQEDVVVSVYSPVGQLVLRLYRQCVPGQTVIPVDLSHLANGSYSLRIDGRTVSESLKFVKAY